MADRLGAIINLDDLTLVDHLERSIGQKICRYNPAACSPYLNGRNPGGFQVMDNRRDAKYGMTRAQIAGIARLSAMAPGVRHPRLWPPSPVNDHRLAAFSSSWRRAEGGDRRPYHLHQPLGGVELYRRSSLPMISPSSARVRRAYEEVWCPPGYVLFMFLD